MIRPPLVLVPALNEEFAVGDVVRRVIDAGYDVCVIDDGSTDATSAVAGAAGATLLRLPLNLGVGGALRCGFRHALERGYDVVVQVDADGQHDPAFVGDLLRTMYEQDADLVIGSRFTGARTGAGTARGRRLAMRVLARRASAATGTKITDATSGFRAIRSPLLDRFAIDYPVEYLGDTVEALVDAGRYGARVAECPVAMAPRQHGEPSAGVAASLWYVLRVLLAIYLAHNRPTAPLAGPREHGASE